MRRRWASSIAAVVALATVGVACSSGSGGIASGGGSSATDTAPVSGSSAGGLASGADTSAPSTTSAPPTSSSAPAPSSSSSTATSAAPSGPQPCATAALSGAIGASNAGAGSVYTTVTLTNRGQATCTLHGYPGVSLSVHGAQLGSPATRAAQWGPVPVTLAPGQATAFVVHTSSGVAGPCQAADALIVYPPNQRASLSIPTSLQLCGTLLETTAVGNHP